MIRTVRLAVSSIAGIGASVFFFAATSISTWWSLLLLTAGWLALVIAGHHYLGRLFSARAKTTALTVLSTLAVLCLLALTEWEPGKRALILFGGALTGMLFFTSIPLGERSAYAAKRLRRMFMMCWVFIAYAFATSLFAASIFFQNAIPFSVIVILGGALYAATSAVLWGLYDTVSFRTHAPWCAGIGIAMSELVWAVHLLPFGYFVLGALASWVWYVAQLLIRFHMTPRGILWRQQGWFLAGNVLLCIVFLVFFVRWI